jgi:hypothetical protein
MTPRRKGIVRVALEPSHALRYRLLRDAEHRSLQKR